MFRILFIDKSDLFFIDRIAAYLNRNRNLGFSMDLAIAVDGEVIEYATYESSQVGLKFSNGIELLKSGNTGRDAHLPPTENQPYSVYKEQFKGIRAIFAHVHEKGLEDLLDACDPSTLIIRLSRDHLLQGFTHHNDHAIAYLDRSFDNPAFDKDLVELIDIVLAPNGLDGFPQKCPVRLLPFLSQPRHDLRALMLLVQAMLVADIENRPQKDEIARALGLPDWVSTDQLRNPDVANFAFLRSGLIKPNASPSRSPDAYPVIAETTVPNLLSTNELLQCMLQRDTLTEAEWALCFAAYKELKDTFHL